jgi:hypothetical protein
MDPGERLQSRSGKAATSRPPTRTGCRVMLRRRMQEEQSAVAGGVSQVVRRKYEKGRM